MNDMTANTEPVQWSRHDLALREKAQSLLEHANVRIEGDRPWDLQVHDPRVFARAFAHGSLGLGEAYMDGWWDTPSLDQFFHHVLGAHLDEQLRDFDALRAHLKARFLNMQRGRKAFKIGKEIPRGGDPVTIDFTPDAPGQFPILCSEYCGDGHDDMKGTLVVSAR